MIRIIRINISALDQEIILDSKDPKQFMNDLKNSVPLPLQIQSAKVGPLTVIQCEEATNTAECTRVSSVMKFLLCWAKISYIS